MAIISEALMHLWERTVQGELDELRLRTLRERAERRLDH